MLEELQKDNAVKKEKIKLKIAELDQETIELLSKMQAMVDEDRKKYAAKDKEQDKEKEKGDGNGENDQT